MYKTLIFVLGLFAIASLSSCVSTRTLATWEKEDIKPTEYTKLLVYCSAPTFATRSTIERIVAKDFTAQGLPAVAASDKLPEFRIDSVTSSKSLSTALSSIAPDVILHINVGGTAESVSTSSTTSMFNKPAGTFGNPANTTYERVSLTKIENKLIDVKTGDLLMSVDTESSAAQMANIKDVAGSLSGELLSHFDGVAIKFNTRK